MAILSYSRSKLLNLYLYEKISSLTTPDLVSNYAPTSKNGSSSTDMVAVRVATGEAKGDGTNGDDGEIGKEPYDHSGYGGGK
ncbi:hypothetical protein Tco_1441754 [Tanacetum coccineum]